jgi:hypothetical protein
MNAMRIVGAEHLTPEQLRAELTAGGRIVFYEFCVSCIVLTLRCPSRLRFLPARSLGLMAGLKFSVVSLLFGWWGVPMGLVYTPLTLFTNFTGGRDVTAQVWPLLFVAPTGEE